MIKRYTLNQSIPFQAPYKIYILSAQETHLLNYETQNIIDQAQYEHIKKIHIQTQEDWQQLLQTSENYSLFPESTIYILSLEKSAMMNKHFIDLSPGEDEIYIIQTQQFKHAFLDHLQQNPCCIWYSMYAPTVQERWLWLSKKLQYRQYTLSSDIQKWFVAHDEIEFQQCQQLLERLLLNFPNPTKLHLDDIQIHLGVIHQEDWQPLIDAWMLQQHTIVQQKIVQIDNAPDLTLLIWILNRNLLVLQALVQGEQTHQTIFQQYKIWNKQIPIFEKAYTSLSLDKIHQAICLLHEVDKLVKTYQSDLARLKLTRLLMEYPHG